MNPEALGTALGVVLQDIFQRYERAMRVDGRWMRTRRVEPLRPGEARPIWTVTAASPEPHVFALQCGGEEMLLTAQELVDGFEPVDGT